MDTDITRTGSFSAEVAGEIRAWMGRKQITGRELARRLDAPSHTWVATRIRGEVPIDLNDLERIANALEVDVTDLIPRQRSANVGYPIPPQPLLRTRPVGRAEVIAGFPTDPLSLYENAVGSRLITDHRSRALTGVQ